jgi:hypothetical protein
MNSQSIDLGGVRRVRTCVLLLSLTAVACASSGGQSGTDESGVGRVLPGDSSLPVPVDSASGAEGDVVGDTPVVASPSSFSPVVLANEANDYAFQSKLSIDVAPVAADPADLTFGWSNLTSDFLGHTVDPTNDIDMVTLLLWRLSRPELEAKINDDDLSQSDLVALGMIYTSDAVTQGAYYDFTSFGMPLETSILDGYMNPSDYPPDQYTYTLMVATGTTAGQGTRMIQAFRPDPTAVDTHVEITPDSTRLEYTADLSSLAPTELPSGTSDITFDWSQMTVNALGHEFIPTNITRIVVANFAQTPAELEGQFLDLETIHQGMWRGDVTAGASARLDELVDDSGAPFQGFDDNGTWVIALFCGACANPAPWYLTVVAPSGG